MSKYSICLDIGGTKVLGAIFDESQEIVFRLKRLKSRTDDIFSRSTVGELMVSFLRSPCPRLRLRKVAQKRYH